MMRDVLPEMAPWEAASFDFNMDLSPSYNMACPTFPTLSFDEPALSGLEFLNDMASSSMDSTLQSMQSMQSMPSTPAPSLGLETPLPVVLRSPKNQMTSVSKLQLLRIADELIEKRLRYSIDAFKRAPAEMVLEGGTPWCHPAIYRESMPACLEGKEHYLISPHGTEEKKEKKIKMILENAVPPFPLS